MFRTMKPFTILFTLFKTFRKSQRKNSISFQKSPKTKSLFKSCIHILHLPYDLHITKNN